MHAFVESHVPIYATDSALVCLQNPLVLFSLKVLSSLLLYHQYYHSLFGSDSVTINLPALLNNMTYT